MPVKQDTEAEILHTRWAITINSFLRYRFFFPKRKNQNTEMGKGVRSKPSCSFIKIFFLSPLESQAFEAIVQFLIKHYPSELFIKLQETANSGEQIFLMSSSPTGLFWCHPLFPSADILGSPWLWLPICLKRQPSHQRKQNIGKRNPVRMSLWARVPSATSPSLWDCWRETAVAV